uniref:Uncharacterized protein n=1 Tax=Cacopsylla melanoneura TaxID=428564 RepID=A0A8D8TLI4_9HEMI
MHTNTRPSRDTSILRTKNPEKLTYRQEKTSTSSSSTYTTKFQNRTKYKLHIKRDINQTHPARNIHTKHYVPGNTHLAHAIDAMVHEIVWQHIEHIIDTHLHTHNNTKIH